MYIALLILFFFVGTIGALTAYLEQPAILLALAFAPGLLQNLPFGLLARYEDEEEDDGFDTPKPMGFTQDVK